jgi:hypothetical protein
LLAVRSPSCRHRRGHHGRYAEPTSLSALDASGPAEWPHRGATFIMSMRSSGIIVIIIIIIIIIITIIIR